MFCLNQLNVNIIIILILISILQKLNSKLIKVCLKFNQLFSVLLFCVLFESIECKNNNYFDINFNFAKTSLHRVCEKVREKTPRRKVQLKILSEVKEKLNKFKQYMS